MRPSALLLALGLCGCSWMTLETAPAQLARGQPARCTDQSDMPTVDAAVAVGLGILALIFDATAIANGDGSTIAVAVVFDVATPIYAISSIWGFHQLDQCKRL